VGGDGGGEFGDAILRPVVRTANRYSVETETILKTMSAV